MSGGIEFSFLISLPGLACAGAGALAGALGHVAGRMQKDLTVNTREIRVEDAQSTYAKFQEEIEFARAQGVKPPKRLVAVRAVTGCQNPIEVKDRPMKAIMSEEYQEEVMMRRTPQGEWAKDVRRVHANKEERPFYIYDFPTGGARNGSRLPVVKGIEASGDLPWVRSAETFEKNDKGLAHHSLDYISGLRVLGTRTVQNHVPVGALVTVIGELAPIEQVAVDYDQQGPRFLKLALRKPAGGSLVITTKTLAQLTSFYSSLHKGLRFTAIGLGAVGAFLIGRKLWLGLGCARRLRQWRSRVRQRRAEGSATPEVGAAAGAQSSADLGASGPGPGADSLCAVCLDKRPECVFPCGHLCVCLRCSGGCRGKCPICRLKGEPIRVYL